MNLTNSYNGDDGVTYTPATLTSPGSPKVLVLESFVYLQIPLFFMLLVLSGAASILEVKRLESLEEKEIGVAGAIAVFAAVSSVFGCYTNVDGCNNVKIFSPPGNCDSP
ncbi:uncharacterized protein TNCV_16671 [Trichonephila clavipes]|nr:uncharacterized protein TNCV_16671 [Trichonephila clavipes]